MSSSSSTAPRVGSQPSSTASPRIQRARRRPGRDSLQLGAAIALSALVVYFLWVGFVLHPPPLSTLHVGARSMAATPSRVVFPNMDGLKLVGLLHSPASGLVPGTECVIMCHGFASCKEDFHFEAIANMLAGHGIATLRFDFTGNGESDGTFSFANYWGEVSDAAAAKAYLESEHKLRVIAVIGHSKGGCDVALYGSKYDGQPPAVLILSGRYHMAEGIAMRFGDDYMERLEKGPIEQTSTACGRTFKWLLTKEAVLERLAVDMDAEVRKISHSHVLVVHGTKDTVIPYSDGEAFHSAISGSELVLVEGADHGYSQPHHTEQMMRAVEEFVLKHRGSGTTVLHS